MPNGKSLGSLYGKLGADTTGWDRAMLKARSELMGLQKTGKTASIKLSQAFDTVGKGLNTVGRNMNRYVTLPIVAAGSWAVKKAADFETLQVQLNALTGSTSAGAKAFSNLVKYSAKTPFQLQDLTRANNTLLGFGENTQNAFEHLKMLGDVAAITGGDLQGISVAFGQAAAEGKLMTRDIRQLINQGVPVIKLLSESMGVAKDRILDLASQGKITFSVLVRAFERATSAGGIFANGTQRLSQTLSGLFSTLKDNISVAMAEIGEAISQTLDLHDIIPGLVSYLQIITKKFQQMSQKSREHIIKVAAALAASGPIALALGKLAGVISGFIRFFRSRFGIILAIVTGIGVTIQWLADNWDIHFKSMKDAMHRLSVAVEKLLGPVGVGIVWLGKKIVGMFQTVGKWLGKAAKTIIGFGDDSEKGYVTFEESAKHAFDNVTKWTQDFIKQYAGQFTGGFGLEDFLGMIKELGKQSRENQVSIGKHKNPFTQGLQPNMELIKKAKVEYDSLGSVIQGVLDNSGTAWDKFVNQSKIAGFDFINFMSSQLGDAITSFAEGIGVSLSGATDSFTNAFEQIILVVLDFAKRLGSLLIGIGSAMLIMPFLQGPGGLYIAGGAALVALASGFQAGIKKRIQNRQDRAQQISTAGGTLNTNSERVISPNDNFLGMNDFSTISQSMNPPDLSQRVLKIQVSGEAVAKGSDLIYVMDQAKLQQDS